MTQNKLLTISEMREWLEELERNGLGDEYLYIIHQNRLMVIDTIYTEEDEDTTTIVLGNERVFR